MSQRMEEESPKLITTKLAKRVTKVIKELRAENTALKNENARLWKELNKWKGLIEFECEVVDVPFNEENPNDSLMLLCRYYEEKNQ